MADSKNLLVVNAPACIKGCGSKFLRCSNLLNPKKIKLLLSAIDNYVVEKDLDVEVRFDIIAIIHQKKETKIEHLEEYSKDAWAIFKFMEENDIKIIPKL